MGNALAKMAKPSLPRRSPTGLPTRPPSAVKGSRTPAATQVEPGMPTVATWDATVAPYDGAKNARSVARNGLRRRPGQQQVEWNREHGKAKPAYCLQECRGKGRPGQSRRAKQAHQIKAMECRAGVPTAGIGLAGVGAPYGILCTETPRRSGGVSLRRAKAPSTASTR